MAFVILKASIKEC